MSSGVDVVILAEDVRHRMLIRRHLRARGYSHHRVRDCPWWPTFETPCLSFVRYEYPMQVQALRNKAHRVTGALVVMVDADDATVEARLAEMDRLLSTAGQPERTGAEHIAVVVSRRNVETWMYFLDGHPVDEETDYKPRCRGLDNGEAAARFARLTWPRRPMSVDCPPSLRLACEVELTRLP